MSLTNQWNAKLYDDKMSFVSAYGKGLLEWLSPVPGENILDVGCGTGDLSAQLVETGTKVTGIDFSASMIETAKQKYPQIAFSVADAHSYQSNELYDAVFSNAALHWMKKPQEVIQSVWQLLVPGGRFVAELGGKGNCEYILQALRIALSRHNISADERSPWYFPSIGEYTALLEKQGFRVTLASHFDRPTTLPDGDQGLQHWLDSFCSPFFAGLSAQARTDIREEVTELLRPALFHAGSWVMDYKRLRFIARKEATPTSLQPDASR
ncbi:methyltransferase domain-containing protein [Brevibacillus parabrevis]|uniref:class I SAM-dependent methyltransferase n=1 Tax=Brevibacillus parabrevis TaxID=54914 RepID=UPI0028D0D4F6|nr:methyltransferase domain-containing protein [Brevibacillus parabrevis]